MYSNNFWYMICYFCQKFQFKKKTYRESFDINANVKGLETHCYSSKTKCHVMRKMISCIPLHSIQQCSFELVS